MTIPDSTSGTRTKALVASLIGSSIEWYDYLLYGTVAPIIFVKRFFPTTDPRSGLLLTYAAFALPFFVRPLGGIIFGHIGDKSGRKTTLILTLGLMGSATFLIGCLPDYAAVGVWAPILLTSLRCLQGFGLGGEWGGAMLLAVEYSRPHSRAFFGSVPQMGVTVGMLLGTAALSIVSLLPEPAFSAWGWRIPFWLSAFLVALGLWMRQRIEETPAFRQMKAGRTPVRVPIVETFRRHRVAVIQAIGMKIGETAPFYVFSVFAITYATHYMGLERQSALNAMTLAAVLTTATIPLMGALADRFGCRRVFIAGVVALMTFAFPYFWLVSLHSVRWFSVATSVALAVCWAPVTAVLGTLYADSFSTEVRYTGITLGYQIGSALAGGTAPLVSTLLLESFGHSWVPVASYLVVASAVSLVTIVLTPDTRALTTAEQDRPDITSLS